MPNRIADRLKSERRRLFVGRTAEKELFTAALTHADPPFFVLYVYGPGGVGKTTLLHELALDARELGADATYLDLRNVEATPDAFAASLAVALGGSPQQDPVDLLHGRSQRSVLLLDTWENLARLRAGCVKRFCPNCRLLRWPSSPAAARRALPGLPIRAGRACCG